MGKCIKYPIMINNLSWSYSEKKVLQNISLTIEKGKFYSVIGPNGSGKTTLLKNISKSLEPKKNTIFIEETELTKLRSKDIAKKIACVPQSTHIDFDFSAFDIVFMGRSPYLRRFQVECKEDIDIVKNAMIATNTWHLRDESINRISGGERQRVIVARALAQETGIVLLDEPISQMDIHHQIELMDTIKSLVAMKKITVVGVLHDLNLAAQYSDFLILLNDAGIAAQGTPEHVLTKQNIEKVYNVDIYIMKNPITGNPHIIPISSSLPISFKAI